MLLQARTIDELRRARLDHRTRSLQDLQGRRFQQNPLRRDCESATDTRNGIAVHVIIRKIARPAIRIPRSIDLRGLTYFQRSAGFSGVETIEGEIEIGQKKFVLSRPAPSPMSGTRNREWAEGQLIGFRVPAALRVRLDPLKCAITRYGHRIEPRSFRPVAVTLGKCRGGTSGYRERERDQRLD